MAAVGVGFGTAALGSHCYEVVLVALEAGFRKFDTAEENQWWYNQKAVGAALQQYFGATNSRDGTINTDDECVMIDEDTANNNGGPEAPICGSTTRIHCDDLRVSTKIPPWELTSSDHIRSNAANSRKELVGFCDSEAMPQGATTLQTRKVVVEEEENRFSSRKNHQFPLDVYYIHAPACWQGWHTRCDDPPNPLLDLRSAWMAMEAVVGLDHSARKIGLSNVRPDELLDIIDFVRTRENIRPRPDDDIDQAPPRIPDVVQSFADPIEPAEELRTICREHQIEFVSYSTLGTQHRSTAGNPVLTSPLVQALAKKYNRSTAEVVLSWALQNGMSVIPRSSQRQHIHELARLLPEKGEAPKGFLDAHDLEQMEVLKHSV